MYSMSKAVQDTPDDTPGGKQPRHKANTPKPGCRGESGRSAAVARLESPGHICDVCGADDGRDGENLAQCAPENSDWHEPESLWDAGFCGRVCCYDAKCYDKFIGNEIPETANLQCIICVEYYRNPMDAY